MIKLKSKKKHDLSVSNNQMSMSSIMRANQGAVNPMEGSNVYSNEKLEDIQKDILDDLPIPL